MTTSLRHNEEALRKLLFMAERNLPSCYVPGSTAGVIAKVLDRDVAVVVVLPG